MKQLKKEIAYILLLTIVLTSLLWSGTTGKIAGTITDKALKDPLIGANIVVLGTSLGAAADVNGQFTILYVPPGTYRVQISFVGYESTIVNNVRVYIDQTARLDVALAQQTINAGEVIVVAERNTVKPDVATSVVAVSGDEIATLPVHNITDVMGMQAGINNNQIRGGGLDQALFMVDGVTMRDPRNNQALTRVAMSSVKEVSVERGGFNAEYGQVQSGVVNVVTNEGKAKGYSGSLNVRMTPPAPKYFRGTNMPDVTDVNSYWLRPYFDPAVCWTGTTSGAWDTKTQSKYLAFEGWNAVSQKLMTDNDPTNDLTPLAAQRVFEYYTRKKQINDQPDYEIDGGFGGPVPLISEQLGNLRFFASYRGQRSMLLFPTSRPDYNDYDAKIILNSDISNSIKLRISATKGNVSTLGANRSTDGVAYYQNPSDFAGVTLGTGGYALINMFGDWTFSLTDIGLSAYSMKLTHMLNKDTYYDVSVDYISRKYDTRPPALRDTSQKYEVVPGFYQTSAPFGVIYSIDGIVSGINEGNQEALGRDQSNVSALTVKADLTSQINFNNLLKTGVEFVYNDLNLNYGFIRMQSGGGEYANHVIMHNFPIRGAAYIQDKLETQGFVLNAGLRLDYSNSQTEWWSKDPFNPLLISYLYSDTATITKTDSKGQWQLSPRLGISHPITENSKLYFNYGHFKQMPQYESAYRFDRSTDNTLQRLGDPNLILAKTISYELGYDHQLWNGQVLVQLAAFYRDISDQQNTTTYTTTNNTRYTVTTSTGYSDIRGFELTLRKSTGRWLYGFLNYTYQASSSGNFGDNYNFQATDLQLKYDNNAAYSYQRRSTPAPFARANINLSTPQDFGPYWLGQNILGDFLVSFLVRWSAGGWTTYNPNGVGVVNDGLNVGYIPSNKIQNNVQYVDYLDATLRISKSFLIKPVSIQIFADLFNLFNTKRLNNTGDQDYQASLHLPKSEAYNNIPGDDKFGDYRNPDAAWQPMESGFDRNSVGNTSVWCFDDRTGTYWHYNGNLSLPVASRWDQVDQQKVDQVLKDKAYINMPNPSTYWFLNPRVITYGLRVSVDF
jgi:outer membrane receptor protein involved in Fe transport